MGGWHLRMTWGQEVCYTSLHSKPASALSLATVWSLWGTQGWLGVERWQLCHRRAAVGHWVSLCVCSVVGWLIVYQLGILSLSCSQYIQTICWRRWDDNACLGVRNTSSIGAWPNSLDRRPPWYCIVSPLLQTNKQIKVRTYYFSFRIVESTLVWSFDECLIKTTHEKPKKIFCNSGFDLTSSVFLHNK
jgi:hypothetical protein